MDSNATAEEYPVGFKSVLGSILAVQIITGIIFNVSVFIACRLSRRDKKECVIGNALNLSLCITDLLITVTGMPMTLRSVTGPRIQESLICLLHEGTVAFASTATAVNLVIISLDRFDAITRPFNRRITTQNISCVVALAWLVAVIGFLSPLFAVITSTFASKGLYNVYNMYNVMNKFPCYQWVRTTAEDRIYFGIFYLVLYVVANTTLVICYFRIFLVAKQRVNIRLAVVRTSLPGLTGDVQEQRKDQNQALKSSEKIVTRVSVLIVLTFMVCWAPHTVINIVAMIRQPSVDREMTQLASLALAYFSSVLHPLLYVFLRKTYRDALCRTCKKNRVTVVSDAQIAAITQVA